VGRRSIGYYRKFTVRVATLEGDVVAWLYVLNDYEGGLPSARYLASWLTPPSWRGSGRLRGGPARASLRLLGD